MNSRVMVIFREIMSEERVLVLRRPVIVYMADEGNRIVGRMTGFNIEVSGKSVEGVIKDITEMVFFMWDKMIWRAGEEKSEAEKRVDKVMLEYIADLRIREEKDERYVN